VGLTWDPAKGASNAAKHGVTFEEALEVFADGHHTLERYDAAHGEPRWQTMGPSARGLVVVPQLRWKVTMNDEKEPLDPPEWTREDFERSIPRARRLRIVAGKLQPGDVAALRRFVGLTQEKFAEALGISVHTLRNWEQDRVTPDGPGLALLRIAARNPDVIKANLSSAA
jgi:putative transcriptional regulator